MVFAAVAVCKNYIGGLGPVWFGTIQKHLVCIDDIERRGKGLTIRDVLGLISNLKERKHCKIVLILNDDALAEDKEQKADFDKYLEKVTDSFLVFEPTPLEAVEIAFRHRDELSNLISANCVALGITNIRVIKKLERFIRQALPIYEGAHERTITQMTQSILLLGWALYEPKFAPSLEFLTTKRGTNLFGLQPENLSDQEAAWNALLDVYGFGRADEMDILLLEGMRRGFFDAEKIKECAVAINRNFQEADAEGDFTQAWQAYHRSFDNNEAAVVQGIYDSFIRNVRTISPPNLNGTVKLLKELKRAQQAEEVIRYYFDNREEEQKFYDLDHYPFKEDVTDPDVIEAFRVKHASFRDARNPKDTLLRIDNGWGDGDLEMLAALTPENYREMFKGAGPDELPKLINNSLQFNRIANASAEMRQIAANAKAALTLIGRESDINRRRVRRYGIDIED
jgi:hypothetical protein